MPFSLPLFLAVLPLLQPSGGEPGQSTITLLDGKEIAGKIASLERDRLRLEGSRTAITFPEIREIRFAAGAGAAPAQAPVDLQSRALLVFNGGATLPGKILDADDRRISLILRGEKTEREASGETIGELSLPLHGVRGFRLREALGTDSIFEETLLKPAPAKDLVFVRQGDNLLKLEGVFRGLNAEDISLEYDGQTRRIRRNRVLGVIFSHLSAKAPAATPQQILPGKGDSDYEGTVWLAGGGRLPASFQGVDWNGGPSRNEPHLQMRVLGQAWEVPLRFVRRVTFSNDRIQFLSDLQPSRAEEVPFFDNRFPYKKDVSVGGSALKLQGLEYRKGLGVHSRSILEYRLAEEFESFIALVGIDDSCGKRGSALVRVLGDERELFRGDVAGGEAPLEIAVPLAGIKVLVLETDFGKDGLDLGDHVNWAEARLVKAAKTETTEK